MDAALAQLADQLQPKLKPARGFAPKVSHIAAALLIVRDGLDSRAVCAGGRSAVPDVPEGAHDRVRKLAVRVREFLSAAELTLPEPAQPQPPPQPLPALPPYALPQPQAHPSLPPEVDELGLPPLHPVPMDSVALPPPAASPMPTSPTGSDSAGSDASPWQSTGSVFPMPDVVLGSLESDASDISGEATATRVMRLESEQRPEMHELDLASNARRAGCLAGPHVPNDAGLTQPMPLLKRARPIDYSRFDHIGSSSESESSPPYSRPPSQPAVFEVPEGARIDLDARSYVEREMLRDPAFRRDGEVPKKLRPKRKPLPSTQMAVAKAQGCSSEKAARRYIKDFGYLHGIGAEPDDFDAFHGDCIQNLPDGRQELWRAGRDFFPDLSSSESGSDEEDSSGDEAGDEGDASSLPFIEPSMAAALKELSLQDEEAPEWSDSEQSDDAAQEMPWAEYSAGRRCDKCARCGLHEHVTRDCTEKVCGNELRAAWPSSSGLSKASGMLSVR